MDIIKDIDFLHIPVNPTPQGAYIADVYETMMKELENRGNAAAITANQLGLQPNARAFVMTMDTLTNIFIVNPVITKAIGEGTDIEVCLSLPGIKCKVKRPKKIVVQGFNEEWEPVKYRFHEMSARIVCHEIDHLDGKLIIDVGERVRS